MPRESILRGLVALANEHVVTALFWHVVLAAALVGSAVLPQRPSRKLVGLLLVMPVVSAATLAFSSGQRFNALALTLLVGLLIATVVTLPSRAVERARGVGAGLGWLMLAYAAVYPHFVQVGTPWQYALLAPVGVLPCPTLALLVGSSLLTAGLSSRAWSTTVGTFAFGYGTTGSFGLGLPVDVPLIFGAVALLMSSMRQDRHESAALPMRVFLLLAWSAASLPTPGYAQAAGQDVPEHADAALAQARKDEKLADDVELAYSMRWPGIAAIVRDATQPLTSTEDVLRARGLADLEAGLPTGVFSQSTLRRRYFAALWLGWRTEASALTVVARLEAARLASLLAARAEVPDVEQRLVLDAIARAASDRLHAFCQRLATLGGSCSDTLPMAHAPAPLG